MKFKFKIRIYCIIKLIALLAGIYTIIVYFPQKWLLNTFGQVTIDQVLWHAFNAIEGVDPKFVRSGVRYAIVAFILTLAWCFCVIYSYRIQNLLVWICTHLREILRFVKTKILNFNRRFQPNYLLMGLLIFSLFTSVVISNKENTRFHVADYIKNRIFPSKDDFFAINTIFPNFKDVHFDTKKNIVIILGESFESTFSAPEVDGGSLIPQMTSLREKGQYIDNMQNIYGSGWTIGALTSWFFGLPLKLPNFVDGNFYHSKRGFLPNGKSVFDLLKSNGYEMVFLLGSGKEFSGKGNLFAQHGNFEIKDYGYWIKQGYNIAKNKGTDWGYKDEFVFLRGREEYERLIEKRTPFVLFIETVDTHQPTGYCPDNKKKFGDLRDAFVNLDFNIASFVKDIMHRSDKDTVIAVIGDHPVHLPRSTPWMSKVKSVTVYNAFFGDIPQIPNHKKNTVVTAYDIAPTLLEMTGAKWKTRRWGLGVSFFSEEPSLAEKIGLDILAKNVSKSSRFYDSLY